MLAQFVTQSGGDWFRQRATPSVKNASDLTSSQLKWPEERIEEYPLLQLLPFRGKKRGYMYDHRDKVERKCLFNDLSIEPEWETESSAQYKFSGPAAEPDPPLSP
eukprot:140329_1